MQLTIRVNCPISVGFIKQFYQLDKVESQKVSPLTIALEKKKANKVEDIYSIYVSNQSENRSPRQNCILGVGDSFSPPFYLDGWGNKAWTEPLSGNDCDLEGADSGIEFSVPGYSGHNSLLTRLFWRKI